MKHKMVIFATLVIMLGGCASLSDTNQQYTTHNTFDSAFISSRTNSEQEHTWSQKMEEQKIRLETAASGTNVKVTQTVNNRLKLEIPSDSTFSKFSSKIKPNMQPVLDAFAASAIQNSNTRITIVGHTDNLGSDAINNPLSIKHAAQAREYLIARGVPSHRIKTEGRGSYEPITTNNTSADRAQNRRIEVLLAEQDTLAITHK